MCVYIYMYVSDQIRPVTQSCLTLCDPMNVYIYIYIYSFPVSSDDKESACNARDLSLISQVKKIPWRREWLPTPVFLLENSMDRPWGRKELDMTE